MLLLTGKTELIRPFRLGLQLADADFTPGPQLSRAGKVEPVTASYTLTNGKRAACLRLFILVLPALTPLQPARKLLFFQRLFPEDA